MATIPDWLPDPPGPFSPPKEHLDFLAQYRNSPDRDHPEMKRIIKQVEDNLAKLRSSENPNNTR